MEGTPSLPLYIFGAISVSLWKSQSHTFLLYESYFRQPASHRCFIACTPKKYFVLTTLQKIECDSVTDSFKGSHELLWLVILTWSHTRDILIDLIISKWREMTKANNELILLTSIMIVATAWNSLFSL